MTITMIEDSVRMNLNLRRVKFLLAIEKIGTMIFLRGTLSLMIRFFKKCGKTMAIKSATHQAITEVPKKISEGT